MGCLLGGCEGSLEADGPRTFDNDKGEVYGDVAGQGRVWRAEDGIGRLVGGRVL